MSTSGSRSGSDAVTSSTAAASVTITTARSAPTAASAGDVATRANPSVAAGERFHTGTACPPRSRRAAIRPPLSPNPRNASLDSAMAGYANRRLTRRTGGHHMAYEVPALPYDYNALEPHIDEQTMRIHHDKHHQAYVDKANAALEGTEWADRPVEE